MPSPHATTSLPLRRLGAPILAIRIDPFTNASPAVPAVLRITEPTEEEARGGMTEGEKTDMVPEDFKKTAAEGAL